jgi:hypothetical protein
METLDRAEKIKDLIQEEKSKFAEDNTAISIGNTTILKTNIGESNQETECDLMLNMDGVECFCVMGEEKQLIASGTLELLRTRDSRFWKEEVY